MLLRGTAKQHRVCCARKPSTAAVAATANICFHTAYTTIRTPRYAINISSTVFLFILPRCFNHPPLLHTAAGQGRRKDITLEEVRQHRTADDAWMVLHGKVYNITPYLRFHPGGADILVKSAGRDGTALFNKYHPWVNAHALLEKCLLGMLQQQAPAQQQQQQEQQQRQEGLQQGQS
jgi:cytochrome-b5 reductase